MGILEALKMTKKDNVAVWGESTETSKNGSLIKKAEAELAKADENVNKCTRAIRERSADIDKIKEQIIEIETNITVENMDESTSQLIHLRGKVEAMTGIIKNLKEQQKEASAHKGICQKELNKLKQEAEHLPNSIKHAMGNLSRAAFECKKAVERAKRLEIDVQNRKDEISAMENRLKALQG